MDAITSAASKPSPRALTPPDRLTHAGHVTRGLGFTDCWAAAKERSGPAGTSRFATRIDYIYLSPALARGDAERHGHTVVERCDHLKAIPIVSDHNGVCATLQLVRGRAAA